MCFKKRFKRWFCLRWTYFCWQIGLCSLCAPTLSTFIKKKKEGLIQNTDQYYLVFIGHSFMTTSLANWCWVFSRSDIRNPPSVVPPGKPTNALFKWDSLFCTKKNLMFLLKGTVQLQTSWTLKLLKREGFSMAGKILNWHNVIYTHWTMLDAIRIAFTALASGSRGTIKFCVCTLISAH